MMEESQIIHIRENLIELLELIIPSASLLSHLLVEDILSRQDIENIKVHKVIPGLEQDFGFNTNV